MDHISRPWSPRERLTERIEHEGSIDSLAHRVAHDAAREEIHDRRQVQPSLRRLDVRDVGRPAEPASFGEAKERSPLSFDRTLMQGASDQGPYASSPVDPL